MPVTPQELNEFHVYAQSRLGQPHPPESLQECLDEWRRERDEEEVVNGIRVAKTEIETGKGISLDQATHRLREELHWYGPMR